MQHSVTHVAAATDRVVTRPKVAHGRRALWLLAMVSPLFLAPVWSVAWRAIPLPREWGTAIRLVLVLVLAVSTITDETAGKIRNWATFPALFWAVAINAAGSIARHLGWELSASLGDIGLSSCLVGGLACFSVTLLGAMRSGTGHGDVKLAAAIGALIGWQHGVSAVLYACVAAVLARSVALAWRAGPWAVAYNLTRYLRPHGESPVPAPSVEEQRQLDRPERLAKYFAVGTLASITGGSLL
jgi:prepilin signal peptidase PulO-like enzyme (type II secretory pathway)